jgi:hypothetical protein
MTAYLVGACGNEGCIECQPTFLVDDDGQRPVFVTIDEMDGE